MYRFKNSVIYYELLSLDTVRTITKKEKGVNPDSESYKECEDLNRKAIERAKERRAMKKEKLSDIE